MRALVIGAGVVGLTSAIRLREAGVDAHVWARALPRDTTSAVAAALWYPYRAQPYDRVTEWGAATYGVLSGLAAVPGSGVSLRLGRELFREPAPDPWWRAAVPEFGRCRPGDLPPGYTDGHRFPAPVVDMSLHLPWLVERLAALGGTVRRRAISALEEARPHADVVVNCTGLGARELVGDDCLLPVRGQVVRVAQVGLTEWLLDEGHPDGILYVVPREREVVLGGTADEGAESTSPDAATAEAILARAIRAVPELRAAPVRGHAVGLRPVRTQVRLEREDGAAGAVVHCYGHGGAGVTLSWGCAAEVTALVTG
ncbi:MAG: FAD-dependent oxidoreductase [Carbonactinosporaceae bacterium]